MNYQQLANTIAKGINDKLIPYDSGKLILAHLQNYKVFYTQQPSKTALSSSAIGIHEALFAVMMNKLGVPGFIRVYSLRNISSYTLIAPSS